MSEHAVAVYFYDITYQVEALKQQNQGGKFTDANAHIVMKNEFHGPLTMILMYLETLIKSDLGASATQLLNTVLMYVNMILISVNDMLDYRLIEENTFAEKVELFKPRQTFDFILSVLS